jgi:hypothetical protein
MQWRQSRQHSVACTVLGAVGFAAWYTQTWTYQILRNSTQVADERVCDSAATKEERPRKNLQARIAMHSCYWYHAKQQLF